jgi:hypothetical protein
MENSTRYGHALLVGTVIVVAGLPRQSGSRTSPAGGTVVNKLGLDGGVVDEVGDGLTPTAPGRARAPPATHLALSSNLPPRRWLRCSFNVQDLRRNILRRFLPFFVGIFAALVLVAPSAFASSPHFISASASLDSSGNLVASFKEAGLGTTVSTESITLSASGTATYACINGGGKHPSATNKETVSGPVSGTGSFPVRNGATTGSLTVGPPGPGTFTCPSGQKLVLAFVSYTNVKLTGLAGDTADIPGTFSACLFPGVGIC